MASKIPASAGPPSGNKANVDGGFNPQATSRIKWNVRGGGDRTNTWEIGHTHQLQGQPNIQGVEITQSPRVVLYCWASNNGSGPVALTVLGPTTSQVKNDAVRIGSFRLQLRA
ncbi:uncharacterized protein TRIVIDRAFT_68649 [Trichoderma virens Gv29-8]|uniref:Uncharacterized protein n=1 Tax=Hypocrea virens (strain Gv29-8 / FGSC 10586) TaxID=413071 RepID=G9MZL9_HYPVG|nr:uncharacterized protein TRIVIDRAFT_68649 [Trichoderma virens Gv29-8]EHK20075.1 hypothetical protein TRIVIDRAFT_68649 [Trichoderma virens Gv29-8]UKZ45981.1 hypothetical protein TrVGV298_000177 [Trichoderma virens]